MELIRRGRAWKFGNNICPDVAISYPWSSVLGKDLRNVKDPAELRKVFMVNLDPEVPNRIRKGDFIVAGTNFGAYRAHEPFWSSVDAVGLGGIIAESLDCSADPNFFAEAIGRALPIMECSDITKRLNREDELEVNFKTGMIKNLTTKQEVATTPLPAPLLEIIEAGGTIPWLKAKVKKRD